MFVGSNTLELPKFQFLVYTSTPDPNSILYTGLLNSKIDSKGK